MINLILGLLIGLMIGLECGRWVYNMKTEKIRRQLQCLQAQIGQLSNLKVDANKFREYIDKNRPTPKSPVGSDE